MVFFTGFSTPYAPCIARKSAAEGHGPDPMIRSQHFSNWKLWPVVSHMFLEPFGPMFCGRFEPMLTKIAEMGLKPPHRFRYDSMQKNIIIIIIIIIILCRFHTMNLFVGTAKC